MSTFELSASNAMSPAGPAERITVGASPISKPKVRRPQDPFPKIHAPQFARQQIGYVALFCSWVLGLLFAPTLDLMPVALSLIMVAMFFLMQEPIALLEHALRTSHPYKNRWQPYAWLGGLWIGMVTAAVPLIAMRPSITWLAVPGISMLVIYLLLRRAGAHQLVLSLVGFAGLAVAAPIARLAAAPDVAWQDLAGLWVLVSAFFSLTILSYFIRRTGDSAVKPSLYLTGIILTIVTVLIGADVIPKVGMAIMLIQVVKLGWIATHTTEFRKLPIATTNTIETAVCVCLLLIGAFN